MSEKRTRTDNDVSPSGTKRLRSNNGSPAPASFMASSIQDQMAAIKAKAMAAKERAAALSRSTVDSSSSAHQSPAIIARMKIEAMKARVAAAAAAASSRTTGTPSQRNDPSVVPHTLHDFEDGNSRARGGLGIGLHPALLGDTGLDKTRNKGLMSSKFSTTIGNKRPATPVAEIAPKKQLDLSGPSLEEIRMDRYYDPNVNVLPGTRGRKSRNLLFHQKGKFVAQAAALRRQAQLEDMKKRIAESAKKAGLDEDRSEQAFLVSEPPQVEWWDEGLLVGDSYPNFDGDGVEAEHSLRIDSDNSVVTRYVQHPVLLAAPQEKTMPPPRPMFMTKQEQAKKRRQDRMEVRKEKQAKVRLGLEPPEPPKVKKSNLMRVLGDQAVKDPTAVEARVNREIAERAQHHETVNQDRKLTKEERLEKVAANQEKDASKGIQCAVFRIDSLAYGKHRYQIDVNAKQQSLTGITLLHPRCNLVIVEGGGWSINKYKKLMLQRIKWTEIAPPTATALENEREHHAEMASKQWLQAHDERTGELKNLTENRCLLIWEGDEKQRSFKKWGSRICETDAEARRALEKTKMENMWQLARNWTG